MQVVNFGSLNIDHVYAVEHFCRAGETIHTERYTQSVGGKGLNQSIAVARSGQPLFHAGALGAGGEQLEKTLIKKPESMQWLIWLMQKHL